MKTAELIVRMLEDVGVEYIFGVPGGAIEDLNTSLYRRKKIRPIVTKHEQGAAFMADGYARVSGRLGVCCATAGPGASNMVTGMASAYADSIPVLALTGQVATSVFGKGAVQESGSEGVNITNIFQNFTKYSGMMITEKRAHYMVQKAVRLAMSDRSRPVHLSLPADVMKKKVQQEVACALPSEKRLFDRDGVKAAAEALINARRPAIIAGWGVAQSRGANELLALAELLGIPVATSPKAKGIFPETHPLSLGVLGFAGSALAKHYIVEQEIDVLLAVGTSFNEMMTCGWDARLQPSKCLIQIDVDSKEMGKNYSAAINLVGDAQAVLGEIRFAADREMKICSRNRQEEECRAKNFISDSRKKEQASSSRRAKPSSAYYHPQDLIEDIQASFPKDTIYFADIGNSMAWAIRHLVIDRPYSFYVSLGFSSMGYATAAAIGAKLAFPDRPIVALAGDGSFLMNGFEVATAVNYNIPVVWVIFNNAMLGTVHHGRKMFKRPVPEGIPSSFKRVDFARVAEGLGARGITVDWTGGITPELAKSILEAKGPTVIDVRIDETAVPPIHSRIATVDKHFN